MSVRAHHLSIVEAVETLSNIADLEYDREIGIVQKHEIILHRKRIVHKTIYWLHQHDASTTINLVREIFRIILHYLQKFYQGEYGSVTDQKSIEGIKALMVLVAEAAKKLDQYGDLIDSYKGSKSSVTEFKEYKQLQEFYVSRIARKKDEGGLSKWILSISLNKDNKIDSALLQTISNYELPAGLKINKRIFVDLATVKNDNRYELFFIRQQDGSRFFSSRLLRNVKLVCDFEGYFGIHQRADPLQHLKLWYDNLAYSSAKYIMKGLGTQLDLFLRELRAVKNNELVGALNKALMALLFSSQNRNLLSHHPAKSCQEYFEDFLGFLREALNTPVYKKWAVHPPNKNNHLAWDLLNLMHSLCRLVYTNGLGWEEMHGVIVSLVKEGRQILSKEHVDQYLDSKLIWKRLSSDYLALTRLFKHHPNGPLLKLIQSLEKGSLNAFDPLHQHNLPQQLFDFHIDDRRISLIRMPAPIYQQVVSKAFVLEEFKGFIKSYDAFSPPKKHLIINLQNRTSWREFARCAALEEMQYGSDFMEELCVVTLAVDTDFYSQLAPYHQINEAATFMDQFQEHLLGEHSGFYFPSSISKKELSNFSENALQAIHRVFFAQQKELSREQRLNFIQFFYLLLEIKLIDWINPDTFNLLCKDGIDKGPIHMALMFIFFKLINYSEFAEKDAEFLNLILFLPAILLRERPILLEPFNRMILLLKFLENEEEVGGRDEFKRVIHQEFEPLFQSPLLQAKISLTALKN